MKEYLNNSFIVIPISLAGLWLISRYNYLLFHSFAEFFSIVIAISVFIFAWNSRKLVENQLILFLGIAYLFVGSIDLLHLLAYKGMGVFPNHDANLPTQLWIAARYMESMSLLLAFVCFGKRGNAILIFSGYAIVTTFLLLSIFYWELFPDCLVKGSGLTPFKKISEYVICLIILVAIFRLYSLKGNFEKQVFRLLLISLILTIFAELMFTFYISVYGISNLIGHFIKIVSFYLIYKTVLEIGLKKPHLLMFRRLKQSQESLQETNIQLRTEIETRKAAQEQIKESLNEKKNLLQEIHHRVKNNMQVVSSLLNLQAGETEDLRTRDILKESQSRIFAMSTVHEIIYSSDTLAELNFKSYISKITRSLMQMYGVNSGTIQLNIEMDELPVRIEEASPLGLIINELVSNSLKYAFPEDRKGEISIRMGMQNGKFQLTIADDGVGMPAEFDWKKSSSLGLLLVRNLAENQLGGSIDMENTTGTAFTIRFSEFD
jgi:two-component sensor histidine kinase